MNVTARRPRRHVFRLRALCAAIAQIALGAAAQAAPTGANVTLGAATIGQSGRVTTVAQSSQKVAINWQGFGIAGNETVNFVQPNAAAVALNRVVGNEASVIAGLLHANGQVFLINSAGVLFTKGSSVQVGGLVASTLDLGDADFAAGRYAFKGAAKPGAAVVNDGTLTAADAGYVALLGATVQNSGVIVATRGTVALQAGNAVRLEFAGDMLAGVTIDEGALAALVENHGAILADGGRVLLTAKAADALLASRVNLDGIVQARTLGELKGEIVATADGGTASIDGTLDASAPLSGSGGSIETSGASVRIADSAQITTRAAHGSTGLWLVDPDGFTIGAGGDISATLLGNLLASNNIKLESTRGAGADGHLNVNDAVSWQGDTTLTLAATKDININAAVTASGDRAGLVLDAGRNIEIAAPVLLSGAHAALAMNTGGFADTGVVADGGDYRIHQLTTNADGSVTVNAASVTLSGADASLSINGTPYTLIHSMAGLAAISPAVLDDAGQPVLDPDTGFNSFRTATDNYAIAQDLDASGKSYAGPVVSALTGSLAGLGHAINGLTVTATTLNAGGQYEPAALIGNFSNGDTDPANRPTLRDLRLTDVNITGGMAAAGLVSFSFGNISDVFVSGTVNGVQPVAGIAGISVGNIDDAHVDVTLLALAGGSNVGGIAGMNYGQLSNSTAVGNIRVSSIDLPDGGITPGLYIGGLAGSNYGVISNSRSGMNIFAHNSLIVGGLVGENLAFDTDHGVITNSTATGSVTAEWTNTQLNGYSYGGLVGDNTGGSIVNGHASGTVTVTAITVDANGVPWTISDVGGLVGSNGTNFGSGGTVTGSTSSSAVVANGSVFNVGGGVGLNFDGALDGVHASGSVTAGAASQAVGGLVGNNTLGSIGNSSATGNVTGGDRVGGLAGVNGNSGVGSIANSSATGSVRGNDGKPGALVGSNDGSISGSSYHDIAAEAAAQAAADAAAAAAAAKAAEEAAAVKAAADAAAKAARLIADVQAVQQQQQGQRTPAGTPPAMPATPASRAALGANIVISDAPAYSATVRSIEVDGEVFELEDDRAKAPVHGK